MPNVLVLIKTKTTFFDQDDFWWYEISGIVGHVILDSKNEAMEAEEKAFFLSMSETFPKLIAKEIESVQSRHEFRLALLKEEKRIFYRSIKNTNY